MIYSIGVLLPTITKEFNVGKTRSSLVHTLIGTITLGACPLAAEAFKVAERSCKRFGHLIVSVAGTILAMAGFTAAGLYVSLANEPAIEVLYGLIGLLSGFGFSLMYLPAMVIIERYFKDNLGLASGIASSGSGLGQFIIAPLLQFIQENLSLADTLYCIAGIIAIALPFILVYRTPENPDSEGAASEEMAAITAGEEKKPGGEGLGDDETVNKVDFCGLWRSYLEILKYWPAVLFLLAYFLIDLGIASVPIFTADRAEVFGLDGSTASYLLSIMGVVNCISRVVWGQVMDR